MGRFSVLLLYFVAVLSNQCAAHFILKYPLTVGFDDTLEGTPPCGSFSVDFSTDNVTNFHVGGDSIAMTSIHPQATWLFRATLDTTATTNWTVLLPPVVQTGLGDFCEPGIMIPASWAGSKGVIGIVQDAPDGILYQCAAVNFVAGTVMPPSVCTNVTGLSAAYTTDAAFSSLPATPSSTSSATSSAAGSATTTIPSTASSTVSSKPSAANTVHSYAGLDSAIWAVFFGCATLVACHL